MRDSRLGFIIGAFGPLLFLAAVLLGGWINPGYSHLADAVSELTEAGAPRATPVQLLFSLSALAMTSIAVGTLRVHGDLPALRWAGWLLLCYAIMALLLATVFPMDPIGAPFTVPGILHLVLVGISALALVAAILLAGHALDRRLGWSHFWPYSAATVVLMAAGGLAALVIVESDVPLLGLAERSTQAAYLQWLFVYTVRMAAAERDG